MNYDAFATTFSNSRKNHPWPELEVIITDMKSSGIGSILDVGCGNGRFLEESEKLWYYVENYLGTDNSRGMIEEARKLHTGYTFEVCDMTDIWTVTTERSFDAILFLASFHHLTTRKDRIKTLREAQKILSPGGKIYMTNWNLLEQPRYAAAHLGNGDFSIKIGEHNRYYHGFTLAELTELFDETGFERVEHKIFAGGRNIYSVIK